MSHENELSDDGEPAVDDHFHVTDAQSANWVVRKVVEARSYQQRVETWAAAEIRRAQREEAFFLGRYGGELEAWAQAEIARQHGRKSVRLPAGTVGFRTEPMRLAVTDEAVLLAWCRATLPEAVQTIERVLKRSVADHVKASGECPQGIEIAGGQQRFFLK